MIFPLASVSRSALRPTQPPAQRVPGVLSPGLKRGRGVTVTTHPHLVPRSRMSRSYTSSPPSVSVACSGTELALKRTILTLTSVISLARKHYICVSKKLSSGQMMTTEAPLKRQSISTRLQGAASQNTAVFIPLAART
jgi:hypothetical protein